MADVGKAQEGDWTLQAAEPQKTATRPGQLNILHF